MRFEETDFRSASTIRSGNLQIGPYIVTVWFVDGMVHAPGLTPFPIGERTQHEALQTVAERYAAMPLDQFLSLEPFTA